MQSTKVRRGRWAGRGKTTLVLVGKGKKAWKWGRDSEVWRERGRD
jgi:hypothetical protein